jgi:two-component system chemotaxis response regulator CheY
VDHKKPQTVLVVEDDPALRKLVKGYLAFMGFSVLEVGDGRSAMAKLNEHVPDLVCLDLMLPESSGYDVCEFIRKTENLKDIPVLMMSARTMPEDRAHAEELGVNGYLIKPFTRAEFTQHVREVLAVRRPRAEYAS